MSAFDERRGLGEIEGEGGARFAFHCTQIVDGSWTIGVNAAVEFAVVPGLLGRWEAAAIEPAYLSGSSGQRRFGDEAAKADRGRHGSRRCTKRAIGAPSRASGSWVRENAVHPEADRVSWALDDERFLAGCSGCPITVP